MNYQFYKFINLTTGKEIESNDLNFLLYDLVRNKGLNLPREIKQRVESGEKVEMVVRDCCGDIHNIVLEGKGQSF